MMRSSFRPTPSQSHVDTVLALPKKIGSSRTTAAACRDAAIEFMNGSAHWGAAELATWLMGPFAELTRHVAAPSSRRRGEPPSMPMLREIDVASVETEMREARAEVRRVLAKAGDPRGSADFTAHMIASGFVARCEDADSVEGWVPTSAARRLADRVLALFAADLLTHPRDYAKALSICAQCQAIGFDELARRRGACHRHSGEATEESFDDLCA